MTMPPEKILISLLSLIKDLKTVYAQEVIAIKGGDTKSFLSLQPRKELLSRDYELRVKEIQARSAAVKLVDPALRNQIAVEQAELAVLAEQSMTLAHRMAKSLRRLHERLIEAARHAVQQDKIQYGAAGIMAESVAAKPIATAINEAV
jgi:hypothetical protein